MTLIIGGSASGKSEFAENLLSSDKKIYIATMMPFGKEAEKRIEKHRKARENKGFDTIECYYDIEKIEILEKSEVLLECLGNLVANEMFAKNEQVNVLKIVEGIKVLNEKSETLYIVSNDIFSDGCNYDESTREYIKNLGKVNNEISKLADTVIEVVCGIPIYLKGEKNDCFTDDSGSFCNVFQRFCS